MKKRFGNQSKKQIVKHLERFLSESEVYNLSIDFFAKRFVISESMRRQKGASKKRELIRREAQSMKPKKRKHSATKKRTRPKIRSVKKGRTVELKGRVY